MQFERSAGIFKAGVLLFLVFGPIMCALAGFVAAPSIPSLSAGDPNGGPLIIGILIGLAGWLMGLAGFIMILVAIYRALVKIDALPVRQQPRQTTQSTPLVPTYDY